MATQRGTTLIGQDHNTMSSVIQDRNRQRDDDTLLCFPVSRTLQAMDRAATLVKTCSPSLITDGVGCDTTEAAITTSSVIIRFVVCLNIRAHHIRTLEMTLAVFRSRGRQTVKRSINRDKMLLHSPREAGFELKSDREPHRRKRAKKGKLETRMKTPIRVQDNTRR